MRTARGAGRTGHTDRRSRRELHPTGVGRAGGEPASAASDTPEGLLVRRRGASGSAANRPTGGASVATANRSSRSHVSKPSSRSPKNSAVRGCRYAKLHTV